MIEFFKDTMRPSSMPLLLILLTPGVLLLYVGPAAKWARRWLAVLLVVYLALSTPFTVALLARTLTNGYVPVTAAAQVRGAQAVVLLSAGTLNLRAHGEQLPIVSLATGLRALEAARIHNMIGSVPVIASGGVTDSSTHASPESEAMTRALLDLRVPPADIEAETESRNTREQAVRVADKLRPRGIVRVAVVTSPVHMARSLAVFRGQGFDAVPAPAPLVPDGSYSASGVLPTERALWLGDAIVYEWAATAYYWWNGWLK